MVSVSLEYFQITCILNIIACAAFVAVGSRAPKSLVRTPFLGIVSSALIWQIFFYFWLSAPNLSVARLHFALLTFGGLNAMSFTFHTAVNFLGKKLKPWILPANYAFGLLFIGLSAWGDLYVRGFAPLGPIQFYPRAGILHPVSLAQMTVCLVFVCKWLTEEIRATTGHRRQQSKWLLAGILVGWLGGMNTYLGFYGIPWVPVLTCTMGLSAGCFAYGAFRHKIIDVEFVIRRTIVFAMLFASLVLLLAVLTQWLPAAVELKFGTHLSTFWLNVSSCFVSFFVLRALHLQLVRLTDRYFFQNAISYPELLSKVASASFRESSAQRLLQIFVNELSDGLRLAGAEVFLRDSDAESFRKVASKNEARRSVAHSFTKSAIIDVLTKSKQPLSLDVQTQANRLEEAVLSEMKERGISLILPLFDRNRMMGFLCLGHRLSRDPFSPDDLDSIIPLTRMMSVLVANTFLDQDLKRARVQIEEAAFDAVTGVYVRAVAMEKVQMEYIRAKHFERSFSLVMIDLDHFKAKNDTYGHQAGDAILSESARRLRETLRPNDFIGRYGGEEFLIFLASASSENVNAIASRLRLALSGEAYKVGDQFVSQTASFGVASFPNDGQTIEELIRVADQNLYEAKRLGRDRVVSRAA